MNFHKPATVTCGPDPGAAAYRNFPDAAPGMRILRHDRKCCRCHPVTTVTARSHAHALELVSRADEVAVHCAITGRTDALFTSDSAILKVNKRELLAELRVPPRSGLVPRVAYHLDTKWAYVG